MNIRIYLIEEPGHMIFLSCHNSSNRVEATQLYQWGISATPNWRPDFTSKNWCFNPLWLTHCHLSKGSFVPVKSEMQYTYVNIEKNNMCWISSNYSPKISETIEQATFRMANYPICTTVCRRKSAMPKGSQSWPRVKAGLPSTYNTCFGTNRHAKCSLPKKIDTNPKNRVAARFVHAFHFTAATPGQLLCLWYFSPPESLCRRLGLPGPVKCQKRMPKGLKVRR